LQESSAVINSTLLSAAADKRGLVVKLRDLKLVEEFAGADGRLRFATTEAFLHRFSLASLEELTAGAFSDKATAIEPLI
jgi:chromosome segregation and condensation protein ScpB